MYRILINKIVKSEADTFRSSFCSGHTKRFETPYKRLTKVMNGISSVPSATNTGSNQPVNPPTIDIKRAKYYLKKLRDNYDYLLNALPSEYNKWQSLFERILPQHMLTQDVLFGNQTWKFYELVSYCLRYDEAKKDIACHMDSLGVNTCVYCNLRANGTGANGKADYTIDHHRCQSKYPYLSASFFNLYPCCDKCNTTKDNDDYPDYFQLYTEKNSDRNPYQINTSLNVLKLYLDENANNDIHVEVKSQIWNNTIVNLDLNNWYNSQRIRNHISKIFLVVKGNNKVQIDTTNNTFHLNGLLDNSETIAIFRTSTKVDKIHKEALTKFNIDFAIQWGLLEI